jgi:hypothetical protein
MSMNLFLEDETDSESAEAVRVTEDGRMVEDQPEMGTQYFNKSTSLHLPEVKS